MKTWKSPLGKKHRTYSQQFEDSVVRSFDSGMSAADIGRKKGRHAHLIHGILRRRGRKPSDNQRRGSPPKSKRMRDAIVTHYQKPSGILETARHFDMPYGTVRKILNKAGVLRPDGRKKLVPEADIDEMVRLWVIEGLSQTAIANKFGTGQTVVSRHLIRRGITPTKSKASGEKHGAWKGGQYVDRKGYAYCLLARGHPMMEMSNSGGYVAEHRLVMAEHLKRPLRRAETVHHVNGVRSDNRIENLQIRQGRHGSGIVLKCACCGSLDLVEVPLSPQGLS